MQVHWRQIGKQIIMHSHYRYSLLIKTDKHEESVNTHQRRSGNNIKENQIEVYIVTLITQQENLTIV
jgi:sulfur transfer protein SufE